MSGLKRICLAVFSLASLWVLAVLALTWYGPWVREVSVLFTIEAFSVAVLSCLAISAVGLVILFFRALFVRKVRTVEVANVDGGRISVTREAIAAQAAHIVEADGTCRAARVHVDAKPSGHVRVHVRVLPHETVDVVLKGAELHDDLITGLALVCGDTVEDVSLEFVEPEAVTLSVAEGADAEPSAQTAIPAAADAEDTTSEIRVAMGASREPEKEA